MRTATKAPMPRCKFCNAPFIWARSIGRWIPTDPASVGEHVADENGNVIFEPRLGHRVHECRTAANGGTPGAA